MDFGPSFLGLPGGCDEAHHGSRHEAGRDEPADENGSGDLGRLGGGLDEDEGERDGDDDGGEEAQRSADGVEDGDAGDSVLELGLAAVHSGQTHFNFKWAARLPRRISYPQRHSTKAPKPEAV